MLLFSIIVPIYNVKEYIGRTLQSILNQTLCNFEIIAIDDGSTDGSGELLDDIAAKDPRIRVFHQPNAGVSAARNLGLDEAKGEWIVFVDGDDALCKNALEVLAGCINRHDKVDLIGYGFTKVENLDSDSLNPFEQEVASHEKIYDCRHQTCFAALNHYMVWSEAFRRDILGNLRFEPLKNGEDVLFCNGLALRAKEYIEISSQLYLYLQREQSARCNAWTQQRLEDYLLLHSSIMRNIKSCNKNVDQGWLKRWTGTLLQFVPDILTLDKNAQKKYFELHRTLLKQIGELSDLPTYLKIWINISTSIDSLTFFRLTSMLPMNYYTQIRK